MNCLVDTHIFLWSLFDKKRISKRVQEILLQDGNQLYVSAVTFWEISLKCALGKLQLEGIDPAELPAAAQEANYQLIQMDSATAASFNKLPVEKHRDPFDRMLIWQAIRQNMILLSHDTELDVYCKYGLQIAG